MEFEIWLSRERTGSTEIVTRESINGLAAVIELGAYYQALGYKYILIGHKEEMPGKIVWGYWDGREILNLH